MTQQLLQALTTRRTMLAWSLGALACRPTVAEEPREGPAEPIGLVLSPERLMACSMSGRAWRGVLEYAQRDTSQPNLSDQDDETNVRVLAKAIVATRTGDARLRADVVRAIAALEGTQRGGRTLALGREIVTYVIAADMIELDGAAQTNFASFLGYVRREKLSGRTLISTHEDRPNNWGAHAGASRIAIARYLDDQDDLEGATSVFRGYLGDRTSYARFKYGDKSWQADPKQPVGINPKGAVLEGHSVDGVLADDQRRGAQFQWPPTNTNYAWEALQGLLLQAILLDRAGLDPWSWSDQALLRAARWLVEEAEFPPVGDDLWQLAVYRRFYPKADFELPTIPKESKSPRPGKSFGFTDFLFG